jgi:hypothetical protein
MFLPPPGAFAFDSNGGARQHPSISYSNSCE